MAELPPRLKEPNNEAKFIIMVKVILIDKYLKIISL